MGNLLGIFETTLWARISGSVFLLLFCFIIAVVYRPSSRKKYEHFGKMALDEEDRHG